MLQSQGPFGLDSDVVTDAMTGSGRDVSPDQTPTGQAPKRRATSAQPDSEPVAKQKPSPVTGRAAVLRACMSGYNTDMADQRLALGLDFGTESVRALLVDVASGDTAGQGVAAYEHGVIDRELPGGGGRLPVDYALQHPRDWLESAGSACRAALTNAAARGAGGVDAVARAVVGIGIDFTSCTMLPCRADGTPLCLAEPWSGVPLAWPKLWKHHGAKRATDRITAVARDRREPWLARYGGVVGLEWFFPKILETLTDAPDVYAAAEVWLEAGDWFVWQLVDGPFPRCDPRWLVRSTCQAGYKALWNRQTGIRRLSFCRRCIRGWATWSDAPCRARCVPPVSPPAR
mgnify:CR=1 FL=1